MAASAEPRSPFLAWLERHGLTLVLLAAIGGLLAHAGLVANFWSDDAFITYRYARNIATGLGPVYNPGERVEGYSNPLFTFLLAAFYRVVPGPHALPWFARALCVASAIATLVALSRLRDQVSAWILGSAILLCVMNTSFAVWSVGGLETTIYGALITIAFVVTLKVPGSPRAQAGVGLLLAAIALSRPEGVLPAGALFLFRLLESRTRADLPGHLRVAMFAAVPVAAYVTFRQVYFGQWLPNTFFAKQLDRTQAFWRGVWYSKEFLERNGSLAVYAPALLAPLGTPGERRAARLAVMVIAIYGVFLFVVGGDWMSNHRFIAPFVPVLFLVVATGWVSLLRLVRDGLSSQGSRRAAWAIPLGCAFLCALFARPEMLVTRDQRIRPNMSVLPYFDVIGRVVGYGARPEWSLATHDIGAVGWYGGTRILDMLGLVRRNRPRPDHQRRCDRSPASRAGAAPLRQPPATSRALASGRDVELRFALHLGARSARPSPLTPRAPGRRGGVQPQSRTRSTVPAAGSG